jgi:hypothetical protein
VPKESCVQTPRFTITRLYSHITALKREGKKATAKSLKPISMRFVSAFVQLTSNATAVKRELRMYFQLKKGMKTVKVESERDRVVSVLHDVLLRNKFQHYSLRDEQVDLVLCAGMASGTGGITAMIRCQNNS